MKAYCFSVVRLGGKHGGIWRGTAEWVTLQNVPGSYAEDMGTEWTAFVVCWMAR